MTLQETIDAINDAVDQCTADEHELMDALCEISDPWRKRFGELEMLEEPDTMDAIREELERKLT